ncbi:MAG: C-glycoside deglycosidase beta subunit domain-containing protein [Candidatus Njordarchaeia archaeon]
MVKVPSFMLKKLYIKKSLINAEDGFQFQIKNTLVNATLVEPIKVYIDNKPVDSENILIILPDRKLKSNEISADSPAPFRVKEQVIIRVVGNQLKEGTHTIGLETKTKEYGEIKFEVKDEVRNI